MHAQENITDTIDLILLATNKYNNTIHSNIKCKLKDVLDNLPPDKFPENKILLFLYNLLIEQGK